MNRIITLPRLVDLLARQSGAHAQTCEKFVKAVTSTIADSLASGQEVKVKGIGIFAVETDAAGHKRVVLRQEQEFVDTINAPFAFFEPVELSEGVTAETLNMAPPKQSVPRASTPSQVSRPSTEAKPSVAQPTASDVPPQAPSTKEKPSTEDSQQQEPAATEPAATDAQSQEPAATEQPTAVDVMPQEPAEAEPTAIDVEPQEPAATESTAIDAEPQKPANTESTAIDMESREVAASESTVIDVRPEQPAPAEEGYIPETDERPRKPEYHTRSIDDEDAEYAPASQKRSFIWGWVAFALLVGMVIGYGLGFFTHDSVADYMLDRAVDDLGLDFIAAAPEVDLGEAEGSVEMIDEEPLPPDLAAEPAEEPALEQSANVIPSSSSAPDAAAATPVPSQPNEPEKYDMVTSKRYLTTMAAEYYGHKNYWVYIYMENPQLGNPNTISAGTKVRIPPRSKYDVSTNPEENMAYARQKAVEILGRFQ